MDRARPRSRSISKKRTSRKALAYAAAASLIERLEPRQLLSGTTSSGGTIDTPSHVVVVVLEDRASGEIGDTTNMPFLNQVAGTGLVYTNAHGLNTPSQEGEMNYLALYSGSTQGITDDGGGYNFTGSDLADQLNSAGDSFLGYSEGLPADGSQTQVASGTSHGQSVPDLYYRAYNPMAMFDSSNNAAISKTFSEFPTNYANLPTVSFVIPNVFDNTHGSNEEYPWAGSTDPTNNNLLKQWSDQWLQTNVGPYLTWAKQNNSLLIITSDEGNRANGFTSLATNDTLMVVNGSSNLFVPGTDSTSVNQYDVLRSIEDMYGLSHLGNAATAADFDTNAAGQLSGATVVRKSSSVSLLSSANPAAQGTGVTFTATVSGSSGTPTGTVTFLDGTTTLGTGTLNASGVATFSTSTLLAATHSITASYAGDTNFSGSVSGPLSEVINPAPSAPANDNFANATIISGTSITVTGTNVNATKETGEPNHGGNAGGASVWWSWTAPSSGAATIDTHGSTFDTLLGVYTGTTVSALTAIAENDNDPAGGTNTSKVTFAAVTGTTYKIAVDGYNGATGSITLDVNLTVGAPQPPTGLTASTTFNDGVHLAWTAVAGATSYQVYRNTSNSSSKATKIGTSTPAVYVDSSATAGTTYYYWVKSVGAGGTSGFSADVSGVRSTAKTAPVNDNFANATLISGSTITVTGTNVGATKEAGEPNIGGQPGGASVWWVWTAPTSGAAEIDTKGSTFDTTLSVFTGTSVSALTTIAYNDDDWADGLVTSKVTFNAVAGTTYHIAVDGYDGITGSIILNVNLT